jgi:hypothetical protein
LSSDRAFPPTVDPSELQILKRFATTYIMPPFLSLRALCRSPILGRGDDCIRLVILGFGSRGSAHIREILPMAKSKSSQVSTLIVAARNLALRPSGLQNFPLF